MMVSSGLDGGSERVTDWQRFCLVLLPITATAGPYLLPVAIGPVNVFFFRSLVLFLAGLILTLSTKIPWWSNPVVKNYALLGAFWITWAALGTFWAPDTKAVLREIFALSFGFLTALVVVNLKGNTWAGLHALRQGWILAFLVAAAVAVWEFTTGNHLQSAFIDANPGQIPVFLTQSTLGQPNNFGAFLVLSTPFIIWSLVTSTKAYLRIFYIFLAIFSLVLSIFSTSKIGFFGIIILYLFYFVFLTGSLRVKIATALVVALLIVGGIAVHSFYSIPLLNELGTIFTAGVHLKGSNLVRLNLTLVGLDFAADTRGIGVGGGNYSYLMARGAGRYWTGHIINPHNWWIEILAQYGILVFLFFVFYLLYLLRIAIVAIKGCTDSSTRALCQFAMLSLLGYAMAAVSNSSYMTQPENWFFLASLVAIMSFLLRSWQAGYHKDAMRRATVGAPDDFS